MISASKALVLLDAPDAKMRRSAVPESWLRSCAVSNQRHAQRVLRCAQAAWSAGS